MSDEPKTVAYADIPSDQRFTMRIVPLPGRLFLAETIGAAMTGLKDIFGSIDPGRRRRWHHHHFDRRRGRREHRHRRHAP